MSFSQRGLWNTLVHCSSVKSVSASWDTSWLWCSSQLHPSSKYLIWAVQGRVWRTSTSLLQNHMKCILNRNIVNENNFDCMMTMVFLTLRFTFLFNVPTPLKWRRLYEIFHYLICPFLFLVCFCFSFFFSHISVSQKLEHQPHRKFFYC